MSEPYQPHPNERAAPPSSGAQPPGYGQVDDSPYVTSSDSYPPPDAYGGYAPPSAGSSSTAMGWVALIAGAISLAGSLVNGLIIVAAVGPETFDGSNDSTFAFIASFWLANVLLLWFGFGLWAVVQGIVAIAQKRGTAAGVGGLILGLIGPWVGVIIAFVGFTTAIVDLA